MPRDLLAEITDVKARQGRLHRSMIKSRVDSLGRDWTSEPAPHGHFMNFVPVSLVTAIEVYFRSLVADLIDHGSPYRESATRLTRDVRFDLRAVEAIQGKRVTVGEFVAHTLTFTRLGDIEAPMTQVIGSDFFHRLGTVVDHWDARDRDDVPPIMTDPETLKRSLARLFEVRHIIVHEMPETAPVGREDVDDLIRAVQTLLSACDWLAFELLTPDAPLTQLEMTAKAYADFNEADRQMRVLLQRLAGLIDVERQRDLTDAQGAWEQYRQKQSDVAAGGYRGGSMMPMAWAMAAQGITEARIENLLQYLEEREGR